MATPAGRMPAVRTAAILAALHKNERLIRFNSRQWSGQVPKSEIGISNRANKCQYGWHTAYFWYRLNTMKFGFDQGKSNANKQKHGLDFF